jgi:hypothetical protein
LSDIPDILSTTGRCKRDHQIAWTVRPLRRGVSVHDNETTWVIHRLERRAEVIHRLERRAEVIHRLETMVAASGICCPPWDAWMADAK